MRNLSDNFMGDFSGGFLKPILNLVKQDDTLCLQIRDKYVNIYYRGGSILKLTENAGRYIAFFDDKYLEVVDDEKRNMILDGFPIQICNIEDAKKWVQLVPHMKQSMDFYYSTTPKLEREFQQLVVRENNNSIVSNDTDYFITDFEYTRPDNNNKRFDLIGIKWLSNSHERSSNRKNNDHCKLAILEMKYGDGAIDGSAGKIQHLDDVVNFCSNQNNLEILKKETISIFSRLRTLGLVNTNGNTNPIVGLSSLKPEFILLFANHKPASSRLHNALMSISQLRWEEINRVIDVKIATASFMGYGLYYKNMIPISDFLNSALNERL